LISGGVHMNNGKQLPNTKKGGFTVIEVIVSLLLISIIMIPLLNSYIFFNQSSARASNETNTFTFFNLHFGRLPPCKV